MSTLPGVIDRFVQYYAALDTQPVSAVRALYHPAARLVDPFGEHQGSEAIERYFDHLLANVRQCRFDIDKILQEGNDFSVSWIMRWAHPRIKGGEILSLPGCSMVTSQGETVIYQRDYYDAGEMLYEHLPILGWAVRAVKNRVRA
ncbi:nuclear transport factor 2 family protein [Enterobacteriaceae bacterium C23F]